jgi:hypothetical protein
MILVNLRRATGLCNVDIHDDEPGYLVCARCGLHTGDDFVTTLATTMAQHLVGHAVAFDAIPDGAIPALLAAFPGGQVPQTANQHGLFAVCADDCVLCRVAVIESEHLWRKRMADQGVELVDVRTLPAEQQAEHEAAAEAAWEADEMRAAADPDPDYGRDLDYD